MFDYFDRIPPREDFDTYVNAVEKYDLPIETVSWFYRLGADEARMSENLQIAREIGAKMHNVLIFTHHADSHVVTNDEIVDCYLSIFDEAASLGVEIAFELHVNMWSENFRRVTSVALAV